MLTPEQIAKLRAARAAIGGPFSTASSMPREQAYARDVYLKLLEAHAPALLDAAERCVEHDARIIGHDNEDMKHDPKSVAQLVKDVLIERDDLARRLGEATELLRDALRNPPGQLTIQAAGTERDIRRWLATLTTPPADGDHAKTEQIERGDLARRLGEATAALLALRKWVDEYSDLVERSKRWVHDSTMWETSSYPELAKEWQALWSRYPESVIDINTTPPADLAAVRGACALALRWLGDPDDPNGTFEDIGAWYQRETGRLRPGKSLPMAMAGVSDEDREKHFCAWADAKGREVRAALKSAGGASRHPLLTDELAHPLALAAVARAERSRIVAWLRGLNVFHGDEPRRIAECIERGDHAKGGG